MRYSTTRTDDVLAHLGPLGLDAIRRTLFTERERGAVHSLASAAARIAARMGIGRALEVDPGRIEIVCDGPAVGRTPPRLLLDGESGTLDVSLSHHGRWVAWAVSGLDG